MATSDPMENPSLTISLLELNCRVITERVDLARCRLQSPAHVSEVETAACREIAHLRSIARRLASEVGDQETARAAIAMDADLATLDHEIRITQPTTQYAC